MGTWGTKTFENDDALDFLNNLEGNDESYIRECLEQIINLDNDEYLEAPDASFALAASEIISALKGKTSSDFPKEAKEWLEENKISDLDKLTEIAKKAIKRIKENSELKELWEESDEFEEWKKQIEDLEHRLS